MLKLLSFFSCLVVLTACTTLGDLASFNPFAEEEKKVEGEREDVFTQNFNIKAENRQAVKIPPARNFAQWLQPGGLPGNNPPNINFGEGRKIWSSGGQSETVSVLGFGGNRQRNASKPIIVNDSVVFYSISGKLRSLSIASGSRIWEQDLGNQQEDSFAPGGGIAADKNVVYAVTGYGEAVALNAADGRILWRVRLTNPARSLPIVVGGKLFFVSQNNIVYALDIKDGSQIWNYQGIPEAAGLLVANSPAVSGDIAVFPFSSGELLAIRISSGEPVWIEAIAGGIQTQAISSLSDISASPVIDGHEVFATSIGGRTLALDLRTGSHIWSQSAGGDNGLVVTPYAVYVVDISGYLVAMDRKNGDIKWTAKLPESEEGGERIVWTGAVLANSNLWLASSDGQLLAFSATDGSLQQNIKTGEAILISPIVASQTMILRGQKNKLLAFR